MKRFGFLLLTGLVLPACSVLEYGDLQRRFERAVQADNQHSVSPFTDGQADYSAVLKKLTPTYIATLDEKMQPNGWMLRGVCAWRSKEYKTAREASEKGLVQLKLLNVPAGSRDAVVLTMLRGLVFESQTLDTWRALTTRDETKYEELKADMKTAWAQLLAAERTSDSTTPLSTRSYLYYQKWRVASDWAAMIFEASTDVSRQASMNAWAHDRGGVASETLVDEAEKAKKQVTGPLLSLIQALGG